MSTQELISAILKLPVSERRWVIEQAIHSWEKDAKQAEIKKAADTLVAEYQKNKELTAFTALDFEKFYEAK